jgi:hypothetical protein
MAGLGKGLLKEKQGVQAKKINMLEKETKAASKKRNRFCSCWWEKVGSWLKKLAEMQMEDSQLNPNPGSSQGCFLGLGAVPSFVVKHWVQQFPCLYTQSGESLGRWP